MAFSRPEPLHRQLLAAGLATVLDTDDFGCWEAAVATTLLSPSRPVSGWASSAASESCT